MTQHQLAALIYPPEIDPAPILEDAARQLHARGVAVAGAIQHASGPCNMELELLPSGCRMAISQNLGSGSLGCRLDASALAEAASIVRKAIDNGPELVVFNKYGAQEAEGKGMHDEVALAITVGIPVVIPVPERFLPQWSAFTGGEFTALPCTAQAVLSWWEALVKASRDAA
ncbi:MAG TPA: DUF2478 domain-containing protein [Noviherbaspirillum sp.]|uniref:DUF2478 domain-containing protein n=1 Tax=Noviherbaspirillum sp. TaxID=1926288 RepID=UPI002B4A3560|nr:DUF2478 domain-containing protein [Noviherbaspirillum sp.]HJV88391.1 DUF2478 domain-containing protein [Noviherbaspirillum sp.]